MFYAIIIGIVVLDYITKYYAVISLKMIATYPLIEGVFHLTYVENKGAAFGILQNARWVFIIITIILVCVLLYLMFRRKFENRFVLTAMSFITGGAIGNLIDRIFLGYVVDFFDFRLINFAVFNVADSFVVIGAIMLMIYILFIHGHLSNTSPQQHSDD